MGRRFRRAFYCALPVVVFAVVIVAWTDVGSARTTSGGSWSAPVAIAQSATILDLGGSVRFSRAGAGAIVWDSSILSLVKDAAVGQPRTVHPAAYDYFGGALATYGASHLLALSDYAGPSLKKLRSLAVDTSMSGGPIKVSPLAVPPYTLLAVAANAAGKVWVLYDSCQTLCTAAGAKLMLIIRMPGAARFGAPRTLMAAARGGRPLSASLAINAQGTVLAAWNEDLGGTPPDILYARLLLANGKLTPTALLGHSTLSNTTPAIVSALDAHGDPVVAYESEPKSDMGCVLPKDVVTVSAIVGNAQGQFSAPQLLDRLPAVMNFCLDGYGDRFPGAIIGLVEDPQPTVLWTGSDAGRLTVDAAELADGRFGATRTVSPPNGQDNILAGLANNPTAGATALWMSSPHTAAGIATSNKSTLLAATATSGDAFSAPEPVAPPESLAFPPSLAVDPVTGRAVAVWTSDPPSGSGGNAKLEYSVQGN